MDVQFPNVTMEDQIEAIMEGEPSTGIEAELPSANERETIDSYSIAASPNVRLLQGGCSITFSPYNINKRHMDPKDNGNLISDTTKPNENGLEDDIIISSKHSSFSENASFHTKADELPVRHGCTMTQMVLNGVNVMVGVGLLSTPSTVKEASSTRMAVLAIFAIICCYIASPMRHSLESKNGMITTYLDMGEAAFGRYGRIISSIS